MLKCYVTFDFKGEQFILWKYVGILYNFSKSKKISCNLLLFFKSWVIFMDVR